MCVCVCVCVRAHVAPAGVYDSIYAFLYIGVFMVVCVQACVCSRAHTGVYDCVQAVMSMYG